MVTMMSIDSSTTCTGVAVWKDGKLKESFVLKTSKDSDDKTQDMTKLIVNVIKKYDPDIVICEDLNVINNIKVAKSLASIVGAISGVCCFLGIFFDKLPASFWRKLVANDKPRPKARKDLKKWDLLRTKELFNLNLESDDEADAILIGLAYINLSKEGELYDRK